MLAELFKNRKAADGIEDALVDEVRYLVRELELIDECVEHQERKIEREAEKRESVAATVLGIGPVTAAAIESEMDNPDRFSGENAIRAFAGLDPEIKDSGKYHYAGLHISKREANR